MLDTRQEFALRIRRAFQKVPYPGRKIGDQDEFQRIRGKRWQELSVEDLNYDHELLFFNSDGLRYYLPAYLLALLEHPDKASSNISEAVFQNVGLCSGCARNFTDPERVLIAEFFERYLEFFPNKPTHDQSPSWQAWVRKARTEQQKTLQQAILNWKPCEK